MDIESVVQKKVASSVESKAEEDICYDFNEHLVGLGTDTRTDNCLQIMYRYDSADLNVTSGIISVFYGYYPKLGPCRVVLRRQI